MRQLTSSFPLSAYYRSKDQPQQTHSASRSPKLNLATYLQENTRLCLCSQWKYSVRFVVTHSSDFCQRFLVPTDNNAPDPEKDMVAVVSWCFQDEEGPPPEGDRRAAFRSGILAVKNPQLGSQRLRDIRIDEYDDELELIHALVDLVHELDPDILAGWEVQRASWGYLATRGREHGIFIIRKAQPSD